jgi:hypothetical protein
VCGTATTASAVCGSRRELIEEEKPWTASDAIYLVKIGYEETSLRERIKEAGGRWNAEKRGWIVNGSAVVRLALEDRVIAWLEPA